MKSTGWWIKNLVLPLTPFIVGTVIRILQSGTFDFDSLSAGELNFSMAMLALVLSVNSSQLPNPTLRDSLMSIFHVGVVLFLVLFTLSVLLEIEINNWMKVFLLSAEPKINSHVLITLTDFPTGFYDAEAMLHRLLILTVVAAAVTLITAIICGNKYHLQDL